jgi:hypothetical protein
VTVPTITDTVPCTDEPAVAVTVMDEAVTPFALSVVVAVPLVPVVPVVADSVPAVVEKVTAAPETTLPLLSFTNAVMVAVVEPSAGMEAAVLLTLTLAGVPVVGVGVVVHFEVLVLLLPDPPPSWPQLPLSPLQPAKTSVSQNRAMMDTNLRMSLYLKPFGRRGTCRINTR